MQGHMGDSALNFFSCRRCSLEPSAHALDTPLLDAQRLATVKRRTYYASKLPAPDTMPSIRYDIRRGHSHPSPQRQEALRVVARSAPPSQESPYLSFPSFQNKRPSSMSHGPRVSSLVKRVRSAVLQPPSSHHDAVVPSSAYTTAGLAAVRLDYSSRPSSSSSSVAIRRAMESLCL